MKKKKTALVFILAIAMTLTLLPSAVFAEKGQVSDTNKSKAYIEETDASRILYAQMQTVTFQNNGVSLIAPLNTGREASEFTYVWEKDKAPDDDDYVWSVVDGENDYILNVKKEGCYRVTVTDKKDDSVAESCVFNVFAPFGWTIKNNDETFYLGAGDNSVRIKVETDYSGKEEIYYQWLEPVSVDGDLQWEEIQGEDKSYFDATELGEYCCDVTIGGNTMTARYDVDGMYYGKEIDDIYYELNSIDEEDRAGVWDPTNTTLKGDVTIREKVTLANEKTYSVTRIDDLGDMKNVSSVTIPATVTKIGNKAIGYYGVPTEEVTDDGSPVYVWMPVENFTIYGKAGSAAEKYAKANGFRFIKY